MTDRRPPTTTPALPFAVRLERAQLRASCRAVVGAAERLDSQLASLANRASTEGVAGQDLQDLLFDVRDMRALVGELRVTMAGWEGRLIGPERK